MKKLILIIFLTFIVHFNLSGSSEAAIRYINSDSDGSATNPTRAFDHPSYTANDSYATLSAAYTAASTGDILEFSGGTSGKSYAGKTSSIDKALTLRGSSISGYNATVIIVYNATAGGAVLVSTAGTILQNLTISGDATGTALNVYANATLQSINLVSVGGSGSALRMSAGTVTGNDILVDGAANSGTSCYGIRITGGTPTFNRLRISNIVAASNPALSISSSTTVVNYGILEKSSYGVLLADATAVLTWNNGVISDLSANKAVSLVTGSVATFNNTVFAGPDLNNGTSGYTLRFVTNGTLNTNNCLINGPALAPTHYLTGTGTWNSVGDKFNDFPYFKGTKEGMGYLVLASAGDHAFSAAITTWANYIMNTYGLPTVWMVAGTSTLTAGDKANIISLYKAGHEITCHGRWHTPLDRTAGIRVTYSGANADMAFVISADGTTLNVTGSGDTHGPIDLTNASYDTLTELIDLIKTWDNFTAALVTGIVGTVPSIVLKDASTALPQTVATDIPLDDDTGPDNRYFKEEVTNCVSDLETIIHADPEGAGYTCKTFNWPAGDSSLFALNWVKNNASFTSIITRGSYSGYTTAQEVYLGNIQIYAASDFVTLPSMWGADYAGLSEANKQIRVRQTAKVLAEFLSHGNYITLGHGASDSTMEEFLWFLDEFLKYAGTYNIQIRTTGYIANEITTSGLWSDAGNGYWNRTFTGTNDYRLLAGSPLIDAGTSVNLYTDYAGNPVPSRYGVDIGAYEGQWAKRPYPGAMRYLQ